MKKVFRTLGRWGRTRRVRVACFGPGILDGEWQSLGTLAWSRFRPLIELVADPRDADLLVIQGPLASGAWPALEKWSGGEPKVPVLTIGAQLPTDSQGYLLRPDGTSSRILSSGAIAGLAPGPAELRAATLKTLETFYAAR